jgi:hypothetical protein
MGQKLELCWFEDGGPRKCLGMGSEKGNGVRQRVLNSEASVGNPGLRSRLNRTLPSGIQ